VDREGDLAVENIESLFLSAVDMRGGPPPGPTSASNKAYLPLVSSPVARKRYTSPTTAMVRPLGGVLMTGLRLTFRSSVAVFCSIWGRLDANRQTPAWPARRSKNQPPL